MLVSRDGEVKIVDFGIAAPIDARAVAGGSRGYVAPEQEAGGTAEPRSDSVGRRRAPVGAGLGPPLRRRAAVDPGAAGDCRQATARDPDARYPDAAAMLAAVSRFLRSATGAMTQAELGTLVRRRAPDIPRRDDGAPPAGDDDVTGHELYGPRTSALPRGREVTFATRIAPPPPRPADWRRRLLIGAGAAGLVALSALGGARLRDASTPVPLPTCRERRACRCTSLPADAALTLDGQPAHAGVVELPAGRHTVAARAPGREPASRTLTLSAGGADDVTLTLAPAKVRLVVRSDPRRRRRAARRSHRSA